MTRRDEIEFRRGLAAPFASGSRLRDAVDIEVNGESLSRLLDGAPLDVSDLVRGNLVAAWSRNRAHVAIMNCKCGDVECGGYIVDVTATDREVTWTGPCLPRPFRFDRDALLHSLAAALDG